MQSYVPVYRKLLWRAAKTTWHHKALWFIGFFAGLAMTGAVTNDVLQLAPKMAPGGLSWQTLQQSWDSFSFGQTFLATLVTGEPGQVFVTLAVAVCAFLSFIFLVLVAQHLVIAHVHRAATDKKRRTLRTLVKELEGIHVGRIFAVDILGRLALLITLLLGALLLRNILSIATPSTQIFAALGVYALALPAAFVINAISMTALIHVVRKNDSLGASLQSASTFFSKHWLAAVEFSAILFLVNFAMSLVTLAGLYLASLIVLAMFTTAASSLPLMLAAITLTGIIILFLIVVLGGMITTFNYAAWTEFLERFERLPAHPRSEHAVRRASRALSR